MKKSLLRFLPLLAVIATLLVLTACGHEHAFGEWKVEKEATCTENGSKIRVCECGKSETEIITAKGHKSSEWITDSEATCTEDGSKHQVCSVCADTVKAETIPAKGHKGGEWITDFEATCTEDGSKHQVCSVCADTVKTETISAKGHRNGKWIIDFEATCIEDGSKHQICSICEETLKTESIKSVGEHNYKSELTTEASCTTEGVKTFTCSACADTYTETIPATGHSWEAATCTAPKTCSTCYTTSGSELGHSKGSDGYCTRCKIKLTIDMKTVVGHPDECSTTSYFGFCFYKNSVDGIKVCWGGENLSGKTINYYTVTIYFYNSVGDPAYSEITGKSSKTIKYVGPVAPNKDLIIFSVVDYVPACSKVVIGEITLEYSDGTSDTGWYGWSTTRRNSSIK